MGFTTGVGVEPVLRPGVAYGFRFMTAGKGAGLVSGMTSLKQLKEVNYSRVVFSGEPLFVLHNVRLGFINDASALCERAAASFLRIEAHVENPELFVGIKRSSFLISPYGEWIPALLKTFFLPKLKEENIANQGKVTTLSLKLPFGSASRAVNDPFFLHLNLAGAGEWSANLALPHEGLVSMVEQMNRSIRAHVDAMHV